MAAPEVQVVRGSTLLSGRSSIRPISLSKFPACIVVCELTLVPLNLPGD